MRNLFALVFLGTAVMAHSQSVPFTIALSAAKSEVMAGEPVDLRVVMTNTSDSRRGLHNQWQQCPRPQLRVRGHGRAGTAGAQD